jgi:hypothetical protein
MSYSTIHTDHSVGDVVFFHDPETDAVHRGVVVSIEARSSEGGYAPKWTILYGIKHKFATDPGPGSLISQECLKATARDAFPPEPPEVVEAAS